MGWLGLRRMDEWDFSRARPLGALIGALLVLVVLILVVTFFATLFSFAGTVTGLGTLSENFDMRAAGVLLAFLLGAPFVMWRTFVAAKQAETAAEALFNEKISAASEGLAARRQVTRVVGRGSAQTVLTEWQDDLVSRAAAIDRLEGLVHERPEAGERIARLLSVYVVELSREYPAEERPEGASPDELRDWTIKLHPARTDIERAANALGRLRQIPGVAFPGTAIDLRRANLQGFDLSELDFSEAWLSGTRMEGANLIHLRLDGTDLSFARLEGAILATSRMNKKTNLKFANVQNVLVSLVNLENCEITQGQINVMFGDGSVNLPDGKTRPDHWPAFVLEPNLFIEEYDKWRADPASYTPPQDRA